MLGEGGPTQELAQGGAKVMSFPTRHPLEQCPMYWLTQIPGTHASETLAVTLRQLWPACDWALPNAFELSGTAQDSQP